MSDTILLIDDNSDLLFNLKILFELNDFVVYTAINGIDALTKIYEDNVVPSIIVCDIMMPKMDGYEFFESISSDPRLNSIPFIFLTAKSSSADVRLGKILGIDDYLTKPFIEEDLLSAVKGKLIKRKKILEINSRFHSGVSVENSQWKQISGLCSYEHAQLLIILWDETEGPTLVDSYSNTNEKNFGQLEKIGVQLFQASVAIYGFQDSLSKESLLISIKNSNKKGFLLFDYFDDNEVRGNQRLFMIALINDEITYFDSLIIQKQFDLACEVFKKDRLVDLHKLFHVLIENGKLRLN